MSGRPSMVGLMALAGSTRDSAMENAAGWIPLLSAGRTEVTVAGVVCVEVSRTIVVGSTLRWPAKYEPPAMMTTAAAWAIQRTDGDGTERRSWPAAPPAR